MKTEEQLHAEMAPLQAALNKLRDSQKLAESKALVGKCFKYRNSYSCPKPDEYWWLYVKVIGVGEYWPVAFEFQTDKDGRITIKKEECFSRLDGYNEIPAKEFNTAWKKLQRRIATAKP